MTLTIMVLGMAVVTYAVKAGIFLLGERVAFPPLLREALSFVPVTVLTAIVVPMVLSPHGTGLEITWKNPQLVAAVAAILTSLIFKRQLLTITVALAVFFAWQLGVLG